MMEQVVKMNPTYQQQAYTYIKDQIFKLGIKPGAFITDNAIAQDLQISRTPVREAFRRLEHEGLLVYEARRGWRVYSLTLHDFNEIFDLKVAIEGMVARQAAACGDKKLHAQLRNAIHRLRKAADEDDAEAWFLTDPQLHGAIFKMANNQRAQQIIEGLNEKYHRVQVGFVVRTQRMQRSIVEHEAIVDAILRGDGDEAERCMCEHQNQFRKELLDMLDLVLPFASNGV